LGRPRTRSSAEGARAGRTGTSEGWRLRDRAGLGGHTVERSICGCFVNAGQLDRVNSAAHRNMKHELVRLASIDWEWLDAEIAPLFSAKGRPATPTRFMIGLLARLEALFLPGRSPRVAACNRLPRRRARLDPEHFKQHREVLALRLQHQRLSCGHRPRVAGVAHHPLVAFGADNVVGLRPGCGETGPSRRCPGRPPAHRDEHRQAAQLLSKSTVAHTPQ
jgi:hypothetical protein